MTYPSFPNNWVYGDSGCCTSAPCEIVIVPAVTDPVILPDSQDFFGSIEVTITDATSGAIIYYTTDGSTPTILSSVYSGPFSVTETTTVRAFAVLAGYSNSNVVSETYTLSVLTVATPVITPAPQAFNPTIEITITDATVGATIFYTTDGSDPTVLSTEYTVPFTLSATTTVKAKAFLIGYTDSAIATSAYTLSVLTVATPVFAPVGGTFTVDVNVTLTTATVGAAIYWTDDGSTPTVLSNLYVGAINLVATTTLKAIGILVGYDDSNVATKVYTLVLTQDVVWGGNTNPTITDFNEWGGGGGETAFQENAATPIPMTDEPFLYPADVLDAGQYAYFAMRDDQDAPLAPLSGGFKNPVFFLSAADFAGAGDGFIDTDANGWPCLIGTRPSDGQTWRQYRLLNQPFASITLAVTQ